MKCNSPPEIVSGTVITKVRCRKCMPCRITRKSEWTARIILESVCHDKSCFVTLTYSPEKLPGYEQWPGGTLVKKDLQLFLKRLRRKVEYEDSKNDSVRASFRRRVRYFAVGEYGEKSGRAHFHAILFGLDHNDRELIESCWSDGFVHIGDTNFQSAQYTAGYTTKKITDELAHDHYEGRTPEFSLQSRKPALGDEAAELIAETLIHDHSRRWILDGVVRIRGRKLPLDSFMRKRISHYLRTHGADGDLVTGKPEILGLEEHLEEREKSGKKAQIWKKQKDSKEKI